MAEELPIGYDRWVGRSVRRKILPHSVEEGLKRQSFEAMNPAPAYAYSSVDEWRAICERFQNAAWDATSSLQDENLKAAEREHIQKMGVFWRARGLGRQLYAEQPMLSNRDQAAALASGIKRIGRDYLATLDRMGRAWLHSVWMNAPVTLDGGKGAPFWNPGTDELSARLIASWTGWLRHERFESMLQRATAVVRVGMVITMYERTQGARKPVPLITLERGRLVYGGTTRGPKIRTVKAPPFGVNWPFAPLGDLLKQLDRITYPHAHGDVNYAISLRTLHKMMIASDLSTFDDTIAVETLELLRTYIISPVLQRVVREGLISAAQMQWIIDADMWIQSAEILAPPRRQDESGCLVQTMGMVKSGERLTSWKDTVVNRARVWRRLTEISPTAGKYAEPNVGFTIFGDDLAIGFDDPKFIARWENGIPHGFKETIASDASFLMKRIVKDKATGKGYAYAYLGRVLDRTLNREDREEPRDAVTAATGIATRRHLLRGNEMAGVYDTVLKESEGPLKDAYLLAINSSPEDLATIMAARSTMSSGESRLTNALNKRLEGIRNQDLRMELFDVFEWEEGRRQITFGDFVDQVTKYDWKTVDKELRR